VGLASTALAGGLLLTASVVASNSTLNNFEIEGDLQAGVFPGSSDPTAAGEDWVDTANTGADSAFSALKCTVVPCAPVTTDNGLVTNVVDGSGVGTGELFRDGLKVDPDPTTFTQGDKENDSSTVSTGAGGNLVSQTPWHIVTGSVPPNKDDLFDVATNTFISGANAELDLGLLRTNNNGSSHVDFELNRLAAVPCANAPTKSCPQRTEGDLLVAFEISPGSITQRFFVWDLPNGTDGGGHGRGGVNCVGPLSGNEHPCPWEEIAPPLDSGGIPNVRAAVNTNELPAQPWGNRLPSGEATNVIPTGGWFEAALDLDALGFSPSCPGFGSASAKSRSSGSSVTSALTDIAGPFPINLNTCGKITIIKNTVPDAAQDFHYTTTGGLTPASFDLDDDADATLSNTQVYNQVTPGSYTVTEGQINGYALTSLTCTAAGAGSSGGQHAAGSFQADIVVGNLGEVTCTYVNTLQQGAIQVTKTSTKGNAPLAGATFAVKKNGAAVATLVTDATGKACVDHLAFGNDYTVQETGAPTGYQINDPSVHNVTVDNNATCTDNPFGGESTGLSFSDTPLSEIGVTFTSLAGPGVTAASIVCSGPGGAVAPVSENGAADPAFDDTNETITNLAPGTYTCVVVVDP
jgi:hypothetical protein